VPASVGLAVLAAPTVELLFQHGKFGGDGAMRTAWVVVAGCAGLLAFCMTTILARGFHALGDTRTPVKVALGVVALNFALNVAFLLADQHWRGGDPNRMLPSESLLALASSITFFVQALALGVLLWRRMGAKISVPGTVFVALAGSAAAVLAGAVARRFAGAAVTRLIDSVFALVAGPDDVEAAAIAWAIPPDDVAGVVAGSIVFTIVIAAWLAAHDAEGPARQFLGALLRVAAVAAPMGYVMHVILKSLPPSYGLPEVLQRVVAPAALGGFFLWFFASLFGLREFDEISQVLKKRRR
jgi:hypothetical protein